MRALKWENSVLHLLNQTLLPNQAEWILCRDLARLIDAIKRLEVRGAPAIGVAAAFGMVFAAQTSTNREEFLEKAENLKKARPTAVNLMWAVEFLVKKSSNIDFSELPQFLEKSALELLQEDLTMNKAIGKYGASLFSEPANILTICNTGSLATAGYGTALGVIRRLFEEGQIRNVFVCETRPLLQGSRLTAYELMEEKIPSTLITDNMAGWVMKTKKIDAVIVGADRIAVNGDTANKIGTYSLALLAKAHDIPFYVAAPYSTFDREISSGEQISIEERDPDEVRKIGNAWTTLKEMQVFNPAFDVTPHELITGIITNKGVLTTPYDEKILNWEE